MQLPTTATATATQLNKAHQTKRQLKINTTTLLLLLLLSLTCCAAAASPNALARALLLPGAQRECSNACPPPSASLPLLPVPRTPLRLKLSDSSWAISISISIDFYVQNKLVPCVRDCVCMTVCDCICVSVCVRVCFLAKQFLTHKLGQPQLILLNIALKTFA